MELTRGVRRYAEWERIGHEVLTNLMEKVQEINNKEENTMEMTAHQVEALAAERLDKSFWAILENNGMVEVPTKREAAHVLVRKAPRHPGHYMVTAA